MNRFFIALTRDGQRFGILDRVEWDYCTLQADDGKVHELQWHTRPMAEAWLQRCYKTWQTWEGNGAGKPPAGWRPHANQSETSPFDRSANFYD